MRRSVFYQCGPPASSSAQVWPWRMHSLDLIKLFA
jgi:hypothetical protein